MCGITATFGYPIDETKLNKSLNNIKHRGPDGNGKWISQNENIMFGHQRLSINDLSKNGQQPMIDSETGIVLICNGEIYNYHSLKRTLQEKGHLFKSRSDSEVIIHAYKEWGEESFKKFDGIFAFILWNPLKKTSYIVRDHMGIKPIYYKQDKEMLFVSSELRGLKPFLKEIKIDQLSLAYLLSISHVPPPNSIIKDVKKIEPGSYLIYRSSGKIEEKKYWDLPTEDSNIANISFEEVFEETVKEQLLSDVPVSLFLSGGIDSSSIAVAARNLKLEHLSVDFCNNKLNEIDIAKGTSEILGKNFSKIKYEGASSSFKREQVARSIDEPILFSSLSASYLINSLASKKNYKVVISGVGGDECFGGYGWHQWIPIFNFDFPFFNKGFSTYRKILNVLGKESKYYSSPKDLIRNYVLKSCTKMLPEKVSNFLGIDFDEEIWLEPFAKHYDKGQYSSIGKRLQRVDLYTFCSAINLSILDQTSMLFGIEGRVPFLGKRLLEWIFKNNQIKPTSPSKNYLRNYLLNNVDPRVLSIEKRGFRMLGEHLIDDGNLVNPYFKTNDTLSQEEKASLSFFNHWYDEFKKSN